ncbi:MAG: nucleoside hydrolase [Eubacterium sp.]|nr:nucleoside hydrolase [Eubacterium sp.]
MTKRNVIIDCDPGIDDALALMLACASEELNILGITIVSGNIRGEQCAENALQVLKLMGRLDIPVYLGETRPLRRDIVAAEETHGDDGLGGVTLPPVEEVRYQKDAIEFLRTSLTENEDVTVLAIGPLTNIAVLLEKYPEAARRMRELIFMGGAFKSHGNCSPVAEFNFWADPDAAGYVLNHLGRPTTMVGLDVTREVVLTPNYRELLHQLKEAQADFIVAITRFYTDFHWAQERTLGCVINDPLAVAYLLDPSICGGEDYYVDVVTEGKAIGMSMVDVGGITGKAPNCRVLTQVDAKAFMVLFLNRLFPAHRRDIDAVLDTERYGKL